MPIEFNELPGWHFVVDEVSAGVYKVHGEDQQGRSVETTGIEPDALLEECKKYAALIIGTTTGSGRE
jgi:hypothetical protein